VVDIAEYVNIQHLAKQKTKGGFKSFMKIYIAGPITGIFNFREKFMAAEEELTKRGHIVLNPSFLPDGLKDYMPTCKAMIDQADALYMLKGHQDSNGATEELKHAKKHNKIIIYQPEYIGHINFHPHHWETITEKIKKQRGIIIAQ
jgi:hypothetical protein